MLFNSLNFAIFLPIVFILYWFVTNGNIKRQNFLLLIASYFFYSCWDWRFLFLLVFSTCLDYYTGIKVSDERSIAKRRFWFWLSIIVNLGFLGVFKYFNFFIENFAEFISFFGVHINIWTLNIILPVGISFYTFHGLSYVIDIYYGRIKPEKNIIDYSLFVSFFPLLVAGPIERATHLLPQLKKERIFVYSRVINGLRQILWGLFQKVVVADQCAIHVNNIFENYNSYSSLLLVIGAFLFAFQIYGDFAGYSNIAIGTAKLLGIDLLKNFAYPYFSRDIAEFWRRWHISLSSWFRDYLYIPLGGSNGRKIIVIRNVIIIFLVSGFWHGANWTFIVWGALNALYFIPLLLLKKNRANTDIVANDGKFSLNDFLSILMTFTLTCIAWIYFRSEHLSDANMYIYKIFALNFNSKDFTSELVLGVLITLAYVMILVVLEWSSRKRDFPFQDSKKNKCIRWSYYLFIGALILIYIKNNQSEFIYFQF